MWANPREEYAKALDTAGLAGVISFSAQDRYFDPDQVVHSGGTYEHFRRHPGFIETLNSNINMDMVGEGLHKHNAIFDWTECPNHLPCYLDGLGDSFMNYLWLTIDIAYLPDSLFNPRGQIFPLPLWEKNGLPGRSLCLGGGQLHR